MLNLASLNTVNTAKFSQRFVRPLYDSYCFSNLPATIDFLLTGQKSPMLPLDVLGNLPTKYNTVIFFFIDAFACHSNVFSKKTNIGAIIRLCDVA